MVDKFDDGTDPHGDDPLNPLNLNKKPQNQIAIAIEDAVYDNDIPAITAAGRGKIAEQILQLAFANGVKVREDKALAEMLATIELDSPIPSEAFLAVAEILSYVYRADGHKDPFDAVLKDANDDNEEK